MVPDFTVHIWQVKGYIKVDSYLKDIVRNRLKEKYGSLRKAELKYGLSDYHHRNLDKKFTRTDILFRLVDICKISRSEVEKHVSEWSPFLNKGHGQFRIKFPLKINPLHLRMVAHLIGDGTIAKKGDYRFFTWSQKETRPMEQLQQFLLGDHYKQVRDKVTIPNVVVQGVGGVLNIPFKALNKERILSKCLTLPREYRVQVFTAIIEDEGSFDKNRLNLRMSDKILMALICKLVDSLGYNRTPLRRYVNKRNNYSSKDTIMYRIDLNIHGLKTFNHDLEKAKQKFGHLAGLWKKNSKLRHLSKSNTLVPAYKRHNQLVPQIIERFLNNLHFSEIQGTYNLTPNQTMSILRHMANKGLIKKVKRGTYIKNEITKDRKETL